MTLNAVTVDLVQQGGDHMAELCAKFVKCPFYRRSDNNRICCEGLEDLTTINLVFQDSNQQRGYKKRLCCDIRCYKDCLIYKMLITKYPE